MHSTATIRVSICALVLAISGVTRTAGADALSGAWTMVKYEGPAAHGSASGLLLFTEGHFSLTYTMDEGGQRWGRAHAGTYTIDGKRLVYHVDWSMEYVSGKPSVAATPSDRETKLSLSGATLTVAFSNGSVQTFKRAG